ncbi:acyltransferase family protein [Streptomyces sp. NPDC006733]|uniref:acyltransferase family protein n=1 Tax=Streptomyces sp. NPDC006733 TaxID=3155460 RepID=UPI0033C5FDDB
MLPAQLTTPLPAERTPGPPPTQPAATRDPFLDNAKLLALVLVVCGHLWEPLVGHAGERGLRALYLLVYAFHMPAFILISGYLSRSYTGRPPQLRRLLSGVLVPYLMWSTLLALFTNYVADKHAALQPLTPVWITWFLISLFLWRLTAPFWSTLRAPVAIAVVIFLASGAFPVGAQLSITRTLQFLPFFVIGLVLRPEHLQRLRQATWLRIAALPLFTVAGGLAYWLVPRLPLQWVYRSGSARELHASYTHWLAQSAAIFLVGVVLTAAFLALVPRRRTWWTHLGAGTMYAFLLHAFIRQALAYNGLYDNAFWHRSLGQAVLTAGSIALALALCTTPVRRVFRPLVEPRMKWLFRPSPSAS